MGAVFRNRKVLFLSSKTPMSVALIPGDENMRD